MELPDSTAAASAQSQSLRPSDCHDPRSSSNVFRSINWLSSSHRRIIRLTQTKNGSARNVPLNSAALSALDEQHDRVAHKPADLVFPDAGYYCRLWFEPALKAAKIADSTWHSNRHTFCSWLAMAGVSIKEIQTLAGHKTITMSVRYAHLSPDVVANASERMVAASNPYGLSKCRQNCHRTQQRPFGDDPRTNY